MWSSYDPQAKGTAHPAGCAAMFTGHYTSPGTINSGDNDENQGINYAGAASVDRVIAYHFAVKNTNPAIITRPFYAAPRTSPTIGRSVKSSRAARNAFSLARTW